MAAFITAAADMEPQVGLTGEVDPLLYTQQDYAEGLAQLTHGDVIGARGFGGRLVPQELDEADRSMLEWFYRRLMSETLHGFDSARSAFRLPLGRRAAFCDWRLIAANHTAST